MHFRKFIRNRVVKILKGAQIPRVGNKVFSFRVRDLEADEVPSIEVYTMSESASKFNEAPRMHDRDVQVVVEIRDTLSEDDGELADRVDDLCNHVEKAILDDAFLGTYDNKVFCVEDTTISSTEYSIDSDNDLYLMRAQITFVVNYKSTDSPDVNEFNALKTIAYNIKVEPGTIGDDEDFKGEISFDE